MFKTSMLGTRTDLNAWFGMSGHGQSVGRPFVNLASRL